MKRPTDTKPLLEFPCDFPIKIFGKSQRDLKATVLTLVESCLQKSRIKAISTRDSSQQNYMAITVVIKVDNQNELDRVYQTLTAEPNIVMVL